jgi:hypothetical protein
MKKSKSFAAMIVAVSMFTILSSCGSGDEKKAAEAAKEPTVDTAQVKTTETTPAVTPAVKLSKVLIVKHKVTNFSKWKTAYEAHDSSRLANGLTSYVLGRGTKDSNMVVVVLKMDDVAKAKAFSSSKDLKAAMQKSGVTGPPTITYLDVVMNDDSKIEQTDRLMVTHKVKNWDAWKTEFDSHKDTRMANGLMDRGLAHSVDDPNSVSIVFAVTDMKKANDFLKSKDLKDKMAKGGVVGPPSFFFYKIVQKY